MCLTIHFLAFDISKNFMTVMGMGIGNSGIGKNGNGNRFIMGMGGNRNGNGFMGMGGNGNRNSPSRTPLMQRLDSSSSPVDMTTSLRCFTICIGFLRRSE